MASPYRAKLDQDIDKFYFIKMIKKHFICSTWKPEWFEKLYQLNIANGMADSQEKRKGANRDFVIIIEIFMKKRQ